MSIQIYKDFLIGEEQYSTWNAYRNKQFFLDKLPVFTAFSREELVNKIDESGEYGSFAESELDDVITPKTENGAKGTAEQVAEQIHKLPFMPEPGPQLPKPFQEALGTEKLSAPVSAYGRALSSYVLEKLKEFLSAGFVVIEDFEETGWASDSIMYEGIIRHVLSNTEWQTEIMASFEWGEPENIEKVDINFMSEREAGGGDSWNEQPEVFLSTGSEKWIFDLNASEGIRASIQISKFRDMGWYA